MEEKITRRQLLVLCFGGMLSPLTRLIPGEMAQAAGKAAWLCPLAALPPVLLVVWLLEVGMRRLPNGGMGTMLQAGYGKALGRVLCVANGIWLFLELVVCLRMYADRFLGSSYRDASGFLLILTLVLLALWESRKSLPATARLAQLSFYPLVAAVAAVLLLSVEEIQAANLLPVWYDDLPEVGYGGAYVVQAFALWFAGYNLYGRVERREKAGNALGWPAALLVSLTLVELAIIGVFGSELAQRIQAPFMVLAKEIRLGKTIERLEAVVIAVWTLSDLLLVVLLERSICRVLADAMGQDSGKELAVPVLAAALFGSLLCGLREETVLAFVRDILRPIRLALAYGVPVLGCLLFLKKSKKREKRG